MIKKIIHDVATGEINEVDLTPEDIAQREIDEANAIAKEQERIALEANKIAALEKLGLTAQELAALLS